MKYLDFTNILEDGKGFVGETNNLKNSQYLKFCVNVFTKFILVYHRYSVYF